MIQGLGSILNSNISPQTTSKVGEAKVSKTQGETSGAAGFNLNSLQGKQESVGYTKNTQNNNVDLSEGALQFIGNIEGVIAQFIDQMDQEVGLSSEKVLETLDQIDFSVLSEKPQQSLENFIALTGVEPESQEKAGQIFVNFLQNLKKASGQEEEQSKTLKVEVLSAQDYVKRQRNEGIDRLNSNFFSNSSGTMDISGMNLNGKDLSQIELPKAFQAASQHSTQLRSGGQSVQMQNDSMQSLGEFFRDANEVSNFKNGTNQNAVVSSELSTQLSDSLVQKLNNLKAKTQAAAGSLAAYGKLSAGESGQLNGTGASATLGPQGMAASQAPLNMNELMLAQALRGDQSSEGSPQGDPSQSFENLVLGQGETKANQSGNLTKGFMVETPQLSPQQKQENFGEIVKHAQVLAKDGGGEMKMQLRPEGVGDINLKVNVKDGQVNVQMIASNKQAKALLEDGVADLKLNLAGNKLTLDDLKIELAQEGRKDYQQNPEDQARQEQREFAQGFMNQYRQEREAFHSGFGVPKRPGTGPAQPSDDIKPIVTESSKDARRRLNLVA